MAEFQSRPIKIASYAGNMSISAVKLGIIISTIKCIESTLPDMGSQGDVISSKLKSITGELAARQRIVSLMGKDAQNIAALYLKSERSAARERAAVNKLVDSMVSSLIAINAAFGPRTNSDLMSDSKKVKDAFIKQFEKDHPEYAKQFEKFLKDGKNNQLTDEDIRNIKYLVYNAPEPYRSIYLKNLSKFKIDNADLGEGAFYKPWQHKLNYSYPECFKDDPRGAYTTVFHECGHLIDDLSEESKWIGSDTENYKAYNSEMGREVTLREAIEYDVYYNKNNPHSMTSIANDIIDSGKTGCHGNTQHVIDALQNGTDPQNLSKNDRMLYNAVVNEYHRTTGTSASGYEGVSDVYGGMSNNKLRTNFGHDDAYWNDKSMAGKELWAEYFSYNMAGDAENLANMKEYFPAATELLDSYANALAD